MTITLRADARSRCVASIKRYFVEEIDGEVGDLQAGFLLDFFLKEIAPLVYNGASADAQACFQQHTADLDGACFVPEFAYWSTPPRLPAE